MEFKVPQFIDIKDKIFGQFTFIQVVYIAGGAFASYTLFELLPVLISIPLIIIISSLALALAFFPDERYGKPFVSIMESALKFYFNGNVLYIWKQIPKKQKNITVIKQKNTLSVSLPNISDSNLKDLAWGIGVKKNIS